MKTSRWMIAAMAALVAGCGGPSAPMATVPHVDLQRFMGPWYVIANIPTALERGAHNAVESYQLAADGSIATTFTFRAGGFDGPAKAYHPRGFVLDRKSNAVWGMRFVWPLKADYRIIHLDDDYSLTVIGREQRDYVWIMARSPVISDADYQRMLRVVAAAGYDATRVERVPQQWPAAG